MFGVMVSLKKSAMLILDRQLSRFYDLLKELISPHDVYKNIFNRKGY